MTLQSIQTSSGKYTIAPFDHRASLAKLIHVDETKPEGAQVLSQLKCLFMQAFSPLCSGVLVDPVYGFDSIDYKSSNCGLILTLEGSGYSGNEAAVPTIIPNWSVHNIKENYAVAKLLLFYHPDEANAVAKKKLVMEIYSSCQYEGIAFLLEPIIYNPHNKDVLSPTEFQEAQLMTVKEFRSCCDIIKIQYPGDALACATITAELDIPWILLSRGMEYSQFRDALREGVENGCAGFAAGRTIWQEIGQYQSNGGPDILAIQQFLMTTGQERMKELIAVVEGRL